MSKKVINLKAVIDFFITVDPIKETQLQTKANKLFSEYNKNRKNKYKLKDFNEANKRDWLNLKNWIDVVLCDSELESISTSRLKRKDSCIKISMEHYVSTAGVYYKLNEFYRLAESYLIFHHLVDGAFFMYKEQGE